MIEGTDNYYAQAQKDCCGLGNHSSPRWMWLTCECHIPHQSV
jgi:hypothetical protein